ncbi:metallophosphoesterase family protein [Verrucomicrobium spinosum]|uniref:metallophosphoesterase family protein n=1 Tax=Verrucomicrobium spinosum TaxID=2736 RepID=UPI00017443ED|nr:metallophosphoesterase family protein [Verrucomicrobium spinosum]
MKRLFPVLVTLFLPSLLLSAESPPQTESPPPRKREPLIVPNVPRNELICFALYTTSSGILKMSAFLYPLIDGEERKLTLEVIRDGKWQPLSEAPVEELGWMAQFRVSPWDEAGDHRYRITHAGGSIYEGLIRRNPVDKDEIVVANFSCNGNNDRGPREDIIRNIKAQNPDLLFFAGDQSYDHKEHYAAWLLFGRQFGEICRDRPVVTIPDDHDVGHPNLWGEGGEISRVPTGSDGGYFMPVPYVNMVQRAQCGHLPDPVDPTPVKNGITVYYTSLQLGGIDFAILEDRKWKTGPAGLVPQMGPRPDHINDPNYDRQSIDVPEAQLLGARQLKFLESWTSSWNGVEMKCVLSQTPFVGTAHLHGGKADRLLADLDCNGWPQSGRNAALRAIRRGFAVHLCGDQHLSTVCQYGINAWGDAPWAFASPAIANIYPRSWDPLEKPKRHDATSALPATGDYYDGFGNKLTMRAYFNAVPENNMGVGYGIARFRKSTREITFELWKRGAVVTNDKPVTGWPVTIRQQDNYGRAPLGWLPTLRISGAKDPVVRIVEESSGETVYALRIQGSQFRPKIFNAGSYTVVVGEGEHQVTVPNVSSLPLDAPELNLEITVP